MSHAPPKQSPNPPPTVGTEGRAVGLDIHPDSFAAAILEGRDPLHAGVVQSITRQPLASARRLGARHTSAEDVLILEASANSFADRRTPHGPRAPGVILESHRAGQIGKSYLANDKVDAAKIARIYLSGWRSRSGSPMPRRASGRELLRPISVA
jgi:hypothetical protein